MKFLQVLLVLLANVLVSHLQSEAGSQFQQGDQQEIEVKRLLSIIRDKNMQREDPNKTTAAINRLGEMHATEAIDDLIQLLTYTSVSAKEKESGLITEKNFRYPAQGALFQIGKPALPALVKVIAETENEGMRDNALRTVNSIFRESPQEAPAYLKKIAANTSSSLARQRLLKAAEQLDKVIKGLGKNKRRQN